MRLILLIMVIALTSFSTMAQGIPKDYNQPKTYTIGAIRVAGDSPFGDNIVVAFSGLAPGQEIQVPGQDISEAIRKLWKQRFFSDVEILVDSISGQEIFLAIRVAASPRLSGFQFEGTTKGNARKLKDLLQLKRGDIVTDQLIKSSLSSIENYYIEKGYYLAEAEVIQKPDSLFDGNSIRLTYEVDRGEKVKIEEIVIVGNEEVEDKKLIKAFRETKERRWWNPLRKAHFLPAEFETDKEALVAAYNMLGYRDARILGDSIYLLEPDRLAIEIEVEEGNKYYFRDITFTGNTKYESKVLKDILAIEAGDVYNPALLEQKLYADPSGVDISSLYMDNGYLFFRIDPVEVAVENDSIDLEVRIVEGPQATVRNVTVSGNTKTHDHVILREIRTRPGDIFSRADVLRSQRELSQLGYFDPQGMNVNPHPNPEDGTVDLEYQVVEKSTDQIELQGGYGNGRLIGTLGLRFNNFSLRNIFNGEAWQPLPSGDGQQLTLRASTNGRYFQSYNFSFTEPWFGGRNPNSLTLSMYHSVQSNGLKREDPNLYRVQITGATIGLGKRLKWPDDFFSLYNAVSYQRYSINNYPIIPGFSDGASNNINFKTILSRNSVDAPIFPTSGSSFSLSLEITPPFSVFNDVNFSEASMAEKYKWLEYHKWGFDAQWYTSLVGKLVLRTQARFGFLGSWNKEVGITPFERYELGGSGLSNFRIDGREIIAMRGYSDRAVTPTPTAGAPIFNKFTLEMRYPFSLNPSATVFGLTFLEAGNSYREFNDYSPFQLKRSVGVGVRVFMPMFGLFGLDWGYPLDNPYPPFERNKSGEFHFTIGQQF